MVEASIDSMALADAAAVGRLVGDDACRLAGRDDADAAVRRDLCHLLERGALGGGQSIGKDVGRRHAGGRVDDQHQVAREAGGVLA